MQEGLPGGGLIYPTFPATKPLMDHSALGKVCALLTAVTWASAVVLLKHSGRTFGPLPLNLFKNTLGLVLIAATLIVGGEGFSTIGAVSAHDLWILLLSGFLGIAVADTLFLHSLNLVGVGIQAIVDCSYSPLVIVLSWWLLDDHLALPHYLGATLVLSAVFVATRHQPPPGRTPAEMSLGIAIGLLAIALIAYAIVLVKPVLIRTPVAEATLLRLVAGTVPLVFWGLLTDRRGVAAVFRPCPAWKSAVPGGILSGYVSMMLWIAGFKYTQPGIAGALNQTSTIFAILLAAWFLKEALTPRKLLAVALALAGVVLVTLA